MGFFGFLGLSDGEQKLMRGELPYDPYGDDAEARKMIVDRYLADEIHSDGGRVEAVSGSICGQVLTVHVLLDEGDSLADAVDHVTALYGDRDDVCDVEGVRVEGVRVEGERAVVEIFGTGLYRDGWR